ncbi:hypothetical protein Tco_0496567 [Tanacetum coccineum]
MLYNLSRLLSEKPIRKPKEENPSKEDQYPRLGIDQSHKTLWGKVTSEYNHHATVQRTKDMITGKWTTLTRVCNKFAVIVDKNARLSGENDSTWQARCYKTFFQLWGSPFVHYDTWDVLKDHHKWRGVKVVKPGRRVRTTEDLEEPNELFRDDTIPRPPGKPRPSKSHF